MTNPGTPLQLWDCQGGVGQQFHYVAETGEIKVFGDTLCLDDGGPGNNGDSIITWPCQGSPNQVWHYDDATGEIRGYNNRCLDASGARGGNGTPIILYDCWGGANQTWTLAGSRSPDPTPSAPVVTVPATGSGTVGTAFSLQVQATNSPQSFAATGLPAGVVINASSGLISGTPTAAGNFVITASGTNAAGTGTATLTLTIAAVTPPRPPPGPGVNVPSSIDATGGTDVTDALNTWIASVPDGSTIVFSRNGVYRLSQGIQIGNRHNLTFEGNGATLQSYGGGNNVLSSLFLVGHTYGGFWADGNSNIVIRNFNLVGNSPTPGVFISGQESQYGILIDGGDSYEMYGNTVRDIYGDGLFTDSGATNVNFHDNHVVSAGRNGFSDISSAHVNVHDNRFDQSGYVTFDLEPNAASEASSFITFSNNVCGGWGMEFFSLDGSHTGANIHDVTVSGNTVTGASLFTNVDNGGTTMDQNITFTNNTSTVTASGPVLNFAHVSGLIVIGNSQPLASGSLLSITDTNNVVSDPNP